MMARMKALEGRVTLLEGENKRQTTILKALDTLIGACMNQEFQNWITSETILGRIEFLDTHITRNEYGLTEVQSHHAAAALHIPECTHKVCPLTEGKPCNGFRWDGWAGLEELQQKVEQLIHVMPIDIRAGIFYPWCLANGCTSLNRQR